MLKIHRLANIFGQFMLGRSPRFLALQRFPLLGTVLRGLSNRVLLTEQRVWTQLQKGAAEGLWLRLNPRTQAGFYESERDLALRELLRKHLRPGMVFYDLGANLGLFALLAARIVGPQGKVFAFEPEPELAPRISEHIEKNNCANVCLVPCAVWSTTGFVRFLRDKLSKSSDYGLGKVNVESGARQSGSIAMVASVALDDFTEKEAPPDFIKCDVEGADVEVFEGAQNLLTKYKPLVECEVHSDQNATRLNEMFQDLGYVLDWYTRDHFFAAPRTQEGRSQDRR